jgi:hypothetical protein
MTPYSSVCDDFSVCAYVNTKMELPTNRETVLHFFNSVQKTFPTMIDFDAREGNEFVLEEERAGGSYRWAGLEPRRFTAGYVNPPTLEDADALHERLLEMAPYHLDIGPINCEAFDVLFLFELGYAGNHDELVAEALGLNQTFDGLLNMPGARILGCEPSWMLALDETCRLQCRMNIETRTSAYQIRTNQFPEAPISVYFTVRQYWSRQGQRPFVDAYRQQRKLAQQIVDSHLIPAVIKPLQLTIGNKP